jgi:hypothetical protein
MSKYNALRDHLLHRHDPVRLSLDEIANIVPVGLPPSAYRWPIWWNNNDPTHLLSRSWGDAGYDAEPDLLHRVVVFHPTGDAHESEHSAPHPVVDT